MHVARDAVSNYLHEKGEPASYQQVHAAAVTGLAKENKLALDEFLDRPHQATSETQKWIESLFTGKDLLSHIAEEKASIESGLWWLVNPKSPQIPLVDRVEECIRLHLFENQMTTARAVKEMVYSSFPSLITLRDSLLLTCLESYAEMIDAETHQWKLRDSEKQEIRQWEIRKMHDSIVSIGRRLNYYVENQQPLLWYEDLKAPPRFRFHILTSAIVSNFFHEPQHENLSSILVLPGSRANLLAYKKEQNPVFTQILDQHFLVVKFRLIRDLDVNPLLSRELFKEQIAVDPPEYRSSQLALL